MQDADKCRKIEERVIRRLLVDLWGKSCQVLVHDGEDVVSKKSLRTTKEVMDLLFATEEEVLIVFDGAGKRLGVVNLVYGNDGWDVVQNYSIALETYVGPTTEWASGHL